MEVCMYVCIGNGMEKMATEFFCPNSHLKISFSCGRNACSTAQKQHDTCVQEAGSVPKGDISMGMQVPIGVFTVLSKACL